VALRRRLSPGLPLSHLNFPPAFVICKFWGLPTQPLYKQTENDQPFPQRRDWRPVLNRSKTLCGIHSHCLIDVCQGLEADLAGRARPT